MQHKTGQKEATAMKFPTTKDIQVTTMPYTALLNPLDRAKLVLPIFGGTSAEGGSNNSGGGEGGAKKDDEKNGGGSNSSSSNSSSSNSSSSSSGGSSQSSGNSSDGDTQQQVADLLRQVSELTTKVTETTTELNGYKQKESDQQRAAMTEQDRLKKDLEDANNQVIKMDQVIQHLAIVNAIQGFKDAEFHEARQVMMELRDGDYSYDVDIDLENGQATVSGIEDALKKIAKDKYWMVKPKAGNGGNGNGNGGTRGSGRPPGNGSSQQAGAATREDMIRKFPVLAAGRSGMSQR